MRKILRYVPRWSIAALLVLALASAGVALAAPDAAPARQSGGGAVGMGYDPLTADETARALSASESLRSAATAAVRTSAALPGQVAVTAPAEEVVLVERHVESKGVMAAGVWPRRADLFLYRYTDDTLVHGVYDYATGRTSIVEEVKGVQLPLSDRERDTAVAVAFADPALRAQMADEYRLVTGGQLTSAAQLDIRVFNYHAGANPEMETQAARACDVNRCAQLLIITDSDVTLYALPIVNLSTMRVVSSGQASAMAPEATAAGAAAAHADHAHEETAP